jgi:two-component system, NtrC family, sensor kinase
MRLAAKITVALILGICAVLAVRGYARVRGSIAQFRAQRHEHQRAIGRLFAPAVARTWRLEGQMSALYLIEYTKRLLGDVDIRWVRLDGRDGGGAHAPALPREKLEPLARGGEVSLVSRAEGGDRLFTLLPLRAGIDGDPIGALELSEPLDAERAYLRATVVDEAITTAALSGVCGLIALGVGTWFVGRPAHKLAEQVRRAGGGDLSTRLALRQRDEIGGLSREMDTMCARLAEAHERLAAEVKAKNAVTEQLRHGERIMATARLAAGLVHELGTPLHVVAGRARMIVSSAPGEEAVHDAEIILKQADRIGHIVRQLLNFARPRRPTRSPMDPERLARKSLELLEPVAQKAGVTLKLRTDGAPPLVQADHEQMRQVVTSLAVNGIQAMPRGGELVVQVRRERARPPAGDGEEGDYLCLRVRDQGVGIPAEHLDHIFEPFFTTKEVGQGTGLGLAICYGAVHEHGGWIAVDSAVGRGSCFSVYLPLGGTA